MKLVYLCGAIADSPNPHTWRENAGKLLPEGWRALNPFDYETKIISHRALVALDYGLILQSSAVLVRVNAPSWGSGMEIAFAHAHDIPILAFPNRQPRSRWLDAHVSEFYSTLLEAIEALKEI